MAQFSFGSSIGDVFTMHTLPTAGNKLGAPPIPTNDAERIAALHSLNVLDTPPEPDYDALVQLASDICQTPIALISLVDSERQWFKAVVGLGCLETPRESSICAHAITKREDIFLVPDTHDDPRFANNPLVVGDPFIRFYAGTPLITKEGWALGTLCVIDRKPRTLSDCQLQSLLSLRRHVVNTLELRRVVGIQHQMIQELERAHRALDDARRIAEEATQKQAEFLATMSHEIRTPMNAVIGMTALLKNTELTVEQSDYVETIQTSGDHLLCVINDILDYSKIEAGKLEIEHVPFSLNECMLGCIRLLSVRAAEKQLKLSYEIVPGTALVIIGDSTRLRQILVNLVSNAVKFTAQGGVHMLVSGVDLSDEIYELTFSVRDTGIGIPPDRLCKLFQRFSQVDTSTTRQYGGTGLGLVISQRLAELQGGRMWVESVPGKGSNFCFTIQVQAERKEMTVIKNPSPKWNQFDPNFAVTYPARILVVEDNPINQKVVGRMLEKLGYTPSFANNGLYAIEALQRQPFDLVLMDVEMPEMDGPTAARKIRAELPHDKQPVIIALTAHAVSCSRDTWLAAGMDDVLTKPIRLQELVSMLRGYSVLAQSNKPVNLWGC